MACGACGRRYGSAQSNAKYVGGYPAGKKPTDTARTPEVAPQPSEAPVAADTRGPVLAATGQQVSVVTGSSTGEAIS